MARRSRMRRRSRKRVTGMIPRLFKALGLALGWGFRHPQPLIVAIVLAIFSVRYRATWSHRTRRTVFYGEVGLFVTLLVSQIVYAN